MHVKIEIDSSLKELYTIIYTNTMTEKIQKVVDYLDNNDSPLCAM